LSPEYNQRNLQYILAPRKRACLTSVPVADEAALGGDLAKWADEKTEPTDKLTLLSGSIASGESRTCLG